MASPARSSRTGPLREAAKGAAIAWRGLRTWSTSPKLMAWGLLPGAITTALFGGLLVLVALNLGTWSARLASVVVDEGSWVYGAVRLGVGLALLAATLLIAVYTFTAVTLTIGQPFFERIGRAVDAQQGYVGEDPHERWDRAVLRSIAEAGRLALVTVPFALVLFLIGLLPVVGGISAFVLGATVGGWFLALELANYPLARRGHVSLAARRAALRPRRALAVGYGAAVFVLFLIPLGAALFMPAAVSGAALLVNEAGIVRRGGDDVVTRGQEPPLQP